MEQNNVNIGRSQTLGLSFSIEIFMLFSIRFVKFIGLNRLRVLRSSGSRWLSNIVKWKKVFVKATICILNNIYEFEIKLKVYLKWNIYLIIIHFTNVYTNIHIYTNVYIYSFIYLFHLYNESNTQLNER